MKMKYYPLALIIVFGMSIPLAHAENGNQVFYRFGRSKLESSRGGQVFTDTNGANGTRNDGDSGTSLGAGLDLAMIRNLGPGSLLGQIAVTYTKYSDKLVRQTTSALLGGTATSNVAISTLEVAISPKYRFESVLEGKLRPWIIPVGLAFLVNSPPSNDSTYLDLGLQMAAGAEYKIIDELSLGVDFRHTFAHKDVNFNGSYSAWDLYAGINF